MKRNSGIIGPEQTITKQNATGVFDTFDAYGASLKNAWPTEIEKNIVSATPSSNQINEGQSVSFVIKTTENFKTGTIFWSLREIQGNITPTDFAEGLRGEVQVSNNETTLTLNALEDTFDEGLEIFVVDFKLDPAGDVVFSSSEVSIVDTSTGGGSEPLILYFFESFVFTNGTQEGRLGPSKENLLESYDTILYDWLNQTDFFDASGGIQLWTVPASGEYEIKAFGAAGGGTQNRGGRGAIISGRFNLTIGEKIKILVGQKGFPTSNRHSSGGGGTFVVKDTVSSPTNEDILVIAGGGAGSRDQANTPFSWMHGVAGTTAESAQNFGGTGGSNGSGAGGTSNESAGGGGFFSNGHNAGGQVGGEAFVNGGRGGSTGSFDEGGFGGGGAAYDATGGGGGYSGGGGGNWQGGGPNNSSYNFGGGGSSFNSGSEQSSLTGPTDGNNDHGKVEITFLA